VTSPGDQYSPQLSPDRAWLLYVEQDAEPGKVTTNARLMRMSVTGGRAEKVLDIQGTATFLTPQATGSSPVLCELQSGSVVFTAFDPVRGRGRELSRAEGHEPPVWGLSPDGSTITI